MGGLARRGALLRRRGDDERGRAAHVCPRRASLDHPSARSLKEGRGRGGGELDADGILAGEGGRPLDLVASVAEVVEPQHVTVVAMAARRHHHAEDLSPLLTGVAEEVVGRDAEALARRGVDAALEAVQHAARSARAAWGHLEAEGRALNPERRGGGAAGRGEG